MVKAETIAEILSLYKRHGWNLRRVLLSAAAERFLSEKIAALFGAAEIVRSEVDAAWFSRASGAGGEAWELRHLSETPFALFELFDDKTNAADLRARLVEMENRLKSRVLISR